MAIYHQHTKLIKRSKAQSSVGAAAYRAGCRLVDARNGKVYDYSKKKDVVYSEIFLTDESPDVYRDRETLWNAVEASHQRKDAQTARDILIALPHEFTLEQCQDAVADFVKTYCVAQGMIVDVNIHRDEENKPHAHLLITKREVTLDGFGKVARAWNTKAQLYTWRQGWESVLNLHLKRAHIEQSVSCKSLADLDIDLASQNLSMAGFQANSRGRKLDEIERYWYTVGRNHDTLMANPQIALKFLTHKKATFTKRDLEHIAFRYSENEAQYTALTQRLLTCPELVRLGEKDHAMRYSSRELVNTEIDVFDDALALSAATTSQLSDKRLAKTLHHFAKKGGALRPDQEVAFRYLTQGSGDYAALVGIAGAGKSYVLGAVAHAYHLDKRKVYGAALSAKIAGELGRDAKLDASRSVARWLGLWRYEEKQICLGKRKPDARLIKPGDVLMIDEANLLGARQMREFTRYCRNQGVSLMTVGDDGQAQSIEASGIFGGLVKRLGAAELSLPIRQKIDWQRDCTTDFFKGDTERALTRYLAHNRISLCDDEASAISQLFAVWEQERFANPAQKTVPGQLLLASTNAMVETLNSEARQRLQARGALPVDGVSMMTCRGERDFAKGDEVLFLQNDSAYQPTLTYRKGQKIGVIENGQRGIVSGSTAKGELIITTVDNRNVPDGREVVLNPAVYDAIDHGYAMTTIKAEGVTYDYSYIYGDSTLNANQLYVGATRHRLNFYGVINSADFVPEDDTLLPDNHAPSPPVARIDERIIRRLSRRHRQELAVDYLLHNPNRTPEQRVADFRACNDPLLRREMAFVVHTNFAAHLDFIQSQPEYDAIIDLARDYERSQLLANANDAERTAWLQVEQYREAKTQTGKCWQQFFAAVEANATPKALAPLAKKAREAQTARNQMAEAIMRQLDEHRVALYHYQIADSVAEASISTETVNRYQASIKASADKKGETALRFFDFLRKQTLYTAKQVPFATQEQKDEWQSLVMAARKTALERLRMHTHIANQHAALDAVEEALRKSVAKSYAAPVFFNAVIDNHRNGKNILSTLHIAPDDFMDEAGLGRYLQAKRAASEHTYLSYERQAFTRLSQHAAQCESKRVVMQYAEETEPYQKSQLAYTLARYPATYRRALATHFRGIADANARKAARFAFYRDAAIGQCHTMLAAASGRDKPIVTAIIAAVEAHYTDRGALLFALNALNVHDEKTVSRYLSRLPLNLEAANFAMAYAEALQDDDASAITQRAFVMAAEPKTYYGFFDKSEWRTICTFAKTYERQLLLENATNEEAAIIHLVEQYRKATQAVAGHVSTSKTQQNTVTASIDDEWAIDVFSTPHADASTDAAPVDKKAQFATTKVLCAKRDALAYAILQANEDKNIALILHDIIENPLAKDNTPDAWAHMRYCKLVEHATRHHTQLASLPTYLKKRNALLQEAQAWQQAGTLATKLADKDDFDMPYWLADWNGLQKTREQLLPLLQHDSKLAAMASVVTADTQLSATLMTWEKAQQSDARNAPPEIDNAYADDLWKQSAPIAGTLAETYLQHKRGIDGIATTVGEDVRFLPRAWHCELKTSFPALVVFSRDSDGTVQAGQRIYLDPNTGDKIAMNAVARDNQKRTFGTISKYPARVGQTPKKPTIIALAEGPETALSISEAQPDWDTYAVLGANNFVHFPHATTPNQPLLLCLDHDNKDSYTRKMQTAFIALTAKGYDVTAVQPNTIGEDFNDVRQSKGLQDVQQALGNVVDLHASLEALFKHEFSAQTDVDAFLHAWQAPKPVTAPTPTPTVSPLEKIDNIEPIATSDAAPSLCAYDEYQKTFTEEPIPATKAVAPTPIDLLSNISTFNQWFDSIDWQAIEATEQRCFHELLRSKRSYNKIRDYDTEPSLRHNTAKRLVTEFNKLIENDNKFQIFAKIGLDEKLIKQIKQQPSVTYTISEKIYRERAKERSHSIEF